MSASAAAQAQGAKSLAVISAGAAKGTVTALQPWLRTAHAAEVAAIFGAVGAMRARLLAGDPCDVIILTQAMLAELERDGQVVGGTTIPIGTVRTGIAVRAGTPLPSIADRVGLVAALHAASTIYVPDTQSSTAGKHVLAVLHRLGIADTVAPRLRSFPNGAIAMRELAASGEPAPLGCTQVTEILYTPGVTLAGALPAEFGLSTLYAAAVATVARQGDLARSFIARLTGPETQALRREGGFE